MSAWSEISKLAQHLLGSEKAVPIDLSLIDSKISPVALSSPRGVSRKLRQEKESEALEILPEYQFVLEAVARNCPAIFVTGRAGTGKSTMIRFLSDNIKNCAVVAPTALAAMNVQGTTIHSFFCIPPRALNPDEAFKPGQKTLPVIDSLGALIIDEVSMVRPDLVDCISNTLKHLRRDDRPFGGISVIFVGDLLQLPPVVASQEEAAYFTHRYKTPNFFSADVFKITPIIPIELTRVFRQSEEAFVSILDKIRLNNDHRKAVATINRECHRDSEPMSEPCLFLVPTNAAAKSINTQQLDSLDAPLRVFEAIVEGKCDAERDRFQAPYRLEIKLGAQVIFVKNKKPQWLNGTLGRVTSIDDDSLRIELTKSGNTVTVERATWEKIQYEYDPVSKRIESRVVGSFKQFPIALGWSITIHKSQGMTLELVRIDLGRGAFCSGQTYVALSRCRSLNGIYLDRPISMHDVKADHTILEFYKSLKPLRNENLSN
jgi:ATP-dependent exoDNAse (exonuclease V) alpha subunit